MKFLLTACLGLLFVLQSFAAKPPAPPANVRTITSLPNFPLNHLKMSLSPKLYKSLLISPVTAWVVAQVPTGTGAEPKILRSDAGGIFDKLALEVAKGWKPDSFTTVESRTQRPALQSHLLIYKIADGVMAVNFAHDDQALYAGIQHSDVWVGVFNHGKWTTVGGTKIIRNFPEPYR